MPQFLPLRASVEWLKKTAKDHLDSLRQSDLDAKLHDAQLQIARRYGFSSWRAMIAHVEQVRTQLQATFPALNSPLKGEETPIASDDPEMLSFFAAIEAGDTSQVASLLARRPALARAKDADGRTPLHAAAQCDDSRIGIILLAHDADPEVTFGESGHTVLSWAVTCHAMDFARTMLRLAVKPDLFTAAGVGSVEDVQGYFDESGVLQPGASRSGSGRFSTDGKRLPCPPESAADQIADALSIACRNGHVEVVRFLLTKQPDVSFRAFAGATPLHWAYFSGSREVVELLLAAGADSQLRDSTLNCTARSFGIMTAVNWGFLFHVKKLLGLDRSLLNIVDGNRSPLHEAAAGGHAEIVRYLLAEGADRKLRNALGQTARDVAVQSGQTAIAELLGT